MNFFKRWFEQRKETSERHKKKVRFGQYFSPALVDELVDDPESLRLVATEVPLTVLYCGIRDFVGMSEKMAGRLDELSNLVNLFLKTVTEETLSRWGTVDKFMGGTMMAFWNAPKQDVAHATHACETALALRAALGDLNDQLELELDFANYDGVLPLQFGIGVSTGLCSVGNFGSLQRFDYTAMGYPVTYGARLKSLSKELNVDILVDAATADEIPEYAFIEADLVTPAPGKDPVPVYALIGDRGYRYAKEFQAFEVQHTAFLSAYRQQNWADATAALEELSAQAENWGLGGLYQTYTIRIAAFKTNPPPPDWQGETVI